MDYQIKVHVVAYPGRVNLMMRYRDPMTGKQVARSAGTPKQREAIKAAACWEAELREGRYQKPSRISWEEFREQFATDVMLGLKPSTAATYDATLNVFERETPTEKLANVTTARITTFVSQLRNAGLEAATIARHLRALKVALRWAHRQGLLLKLPTFEMPKQAKGMKGRPITLEEFERMLMSIGKVLAPPADDGSAPALPCAAEALAAWQFYLRGLWTSGLRLGESLGLRWDEAPGAMIVDFSGRRPMLRVHAESEKGNTHRLLPMAPEFANLLDAVPEERRRGRVFQLLNRDGAPYSSTRNTIGPILSAIGEAAGVIVDQRERRGEDGKPAIVKKYASAHDLRRAFGFRWSRLVMPPVLKELMRHTEIATTMKFYVGVNAEATADELWRVVEGNTLGNNAQKSTPAKDEKRGRKSLPRK